MHEKSTVRRPTVRLPSLLFADVDSVDLATVNDVNIAKAAATLYWFRRAARPTKTNALESDLSSCFDFSTTSCLGI